MRAFSVSKLTSKGQATIPKRVRQKLGLKSGDSVAFKLREGLVYLQKARPVDHTFAQAVGESLRENRGWPLDVEITDLKAAALPHASVVRTKVFTLDERFMLRTAGSLGTKDRRAVQSSLQRLLPILA